MKTGKRFINYIGIILLSLIVMTSCESGDDGYEQYVNPMGNNPIFTLPWMNNVRKSLFKKQAAILQYKVDEKLYFAAYTYFPPIELNGSVTVSCTIYQNNVKEPVIFFESDNVLDDTLPENVIYQQFLEYGTMQYVLWQNIPKNEDDLIDWIFE